MVKVLLTIIGTIVLLLAETWGQHITHEITENNDGSVTLQATLHVPADREDPNTIFTWTLPDNTVIRAGESHGSFETVSGAQHGSSVHLLTAKNGYTTSKQVFVFRAQARRWWRSFTFELGARNTGNGNNVDGRFATLAPDTRDNSDGSVSLYITVSGGNPTPNRFQWTLPGGETLSPGRTSGSFRANWPRFNSDGSSTYRLDLRNGRTSSPQSFTFRAEATGAGGWWRTRTFNLPPKTQHVTNKRGRIRGSWHVDFAGTIRIVAEIIDGQPPATTYVWTVQNPDGTFTNYQPGSGPASAIRENNAGNPSTTLTVTSLASRSRRFTLRVSSVVAGRERWWSRAWWDIGATQHK